MMEGEKHVPTSKPSPIRTIVVIVVVSILSLGCSLSPRNPEETVERFWEAVEEGNYEEAQQYLTDDTDFSPEEVWFDESDDLISDEMTQAIMERTSITVDGHTLDNGEADVYITVTWPNLTVFFGNFMVEAFSVSLGVAFSGASEEQLDMMLTPLFLKALENTPDVKTKNTVRMVLLGGAWEIASSPLPDPEEAFDLPDDTWFAD